MTAGGGILHDELPSERVYTQGGPSHGVQLWVNLPAALKMVTRATRRSRPTPCSCSRPTTSGALARLIAGTIGGHEGAGSTYTPITYTHTYVSPGAELVVPWTPSFNALAYVLTGAGSVGEERRPVSAHQLVVFGPGDHLVLRAGAEAGEREPLEVLLLGGQPIAEPRSSTTARSS